MRKLLAVCLCTGMAAVFSGCSLGNILEEITSTGDFSAEAPASEIISGEVKERVYMDEISGRLQDFTGSTLTLSAEDSSYVFDISQASIECKSGIIIGDEISIIYEGQLENTDTSVVKALKVVDEFHKKSKLKTHTLTGTIQGLTANTITVKSDKGITAVYPITGTEQYYQNGIQIGSPVYLKFKGTEPAGERSASAAIAADNRKVLSISDLADFKTGSGDAISAPGPDSEGISQFRATIQSMNLPALQVLPDGKLTSLNLDLTGIPVHFIGGIAPGSHVTVTYSGEFKGDTLNGVTVLSVQGEDPKKLNDKHVSFSVTGTVKGTTANTVTLQTTDGAMDTFRIENADDRSSGGLIEGSFVRITFHPARSGKSNIYEALKIEDA